MAGDLHDEVSERLRAGDQRYTAARRALVEVLSGAKRPLSISEVMSANPDAPQSSVYRNLTVLEQLGVVRRISTSEDFGRFELTEDLTEHHHHLVCRSCGSVIDYESSQAVEGALKLAVEAIGTSTGFRVDAHQLDLMGTCRRCAGRK